MGAFPYTDVWASMRAAFYYPWFPETWGQTPTAHPSLGEYPSSLGVIQNHIALMRYARCKAAIASWWGPDSAYSARFDSCLKAAEGTTFQWCLYYEAEGYSDPTASSLDADLDYVEARWASHPNYLHAGGKPVIFAYAGPGDGAAMPTRWQQANLGRFHTCLKLFPGFRDVPAQPSSWHEYAPASGRSDFAPYSFSISPGFAKAGEPVRLPRDLVRFQADAEAMVASRARWQLVTTFNEWGEGTAVEPALEWGTTYLDVLAAVR